LLWTFIPTAILTIPWFLAFRAACGVFVPSWLNPDPVLADQSAFLQTMLHRPFYYYFAKLPLLVPLLPIAIVGLAAKRSLMKDGIALLGAAWALLFLLTLTAIGLGGMGFQMRYIASGMPSIYVLCALVLARQEKSDSCLTVLCMVAIAFAIVCSGVYVWLPAPDELNSFPEMVGWIKF
jgi:hypothetical protein